MDELKEGRAVEQRARLDLQSKVESLEQEQKSEDDFILVSA